jgi:hypothetical protein
MISRLLGAGAAVVALLAGVSTVQSQSAANVGSLSGAVAGGGERIRRVLQNCYARVVQTMSQRYDGKPDSLRLTIAELVPNIQSYIFDAGYKIPTDVARAVVCQAIIAAGIATDDQVKRATT